MLSSQILSFAISNDDDPESEVIAPDYANFYIPPDFPTKIYKNIKPISPSLETKQARHFRTVLRTAATQMPNFAGNIVVTRWGCGSGCESFALINVQTGKVWFPNFDMFYPFDNFKKGMGIYYQPDSNLFVAIGCQEGWSAPPTVYYYLWTGKTLNLLKTESQL